MKFGSHVLPWRHVEIDTKTRKRTNDAVADQVKNGDGSSARKVDSGPTSSIILGTKAEPPALPLRDDALVDKGATAPKLCVSPVEMRTPTAADSLLLSGTASTATRTIFH